MRETEKETQDEKEPAVEDSNLVSKIRNTHKIRDKDSVTNFYLGNLPNDISVKEIRDESGNLGHIVDVFIPRKRDKMGGRFGFIKFVKVKDPDKLLKDLSNLKFGGLKVQVNLARYDRNGQKVVPPTRSSSSGRQIEDAVNFRLISGGSRGSWSGECIPRSYKEVLNGSGGDMNPDLRILKEVVFNNNPLDLSGCSWRKVSLVGETKSLGILCGLKEDVSALRVPGKLELRYLWGLKVMLSFETTDQAKAFLLERESDWKGFFFSLEMWVDQEIPFDRVAWLRIQGVPLHLWDKEVFDQIAMRYGEVLHGSEAGLSDRNLSYDQVAVKVSTGDQICDTFLLKWNNISVKVWVSEDGGLWAPNFLDTRNPSLITSPKFSPSIGGSVIKNVSPASFGGSTPGERFSDIRGEAEKSTSSLLGNDELHSEFCSGDHIPKTADNCACKKTNGSMILNLNSNHNDKDMGLKVGEPMLETSLDSGGPLKSPLGGITSPVKEVGNNGDGVLGPLHKSKSLNKTRLLDLNFSDNILMKPSRRIFSFNSRPRRKRRSKRCSHNPNISSNDEESSSSGETGSEASVWLGETADPIPQSVQPDGGLEDGATDEDNDFEPPVIDELLIENETQETVNLGELLGVNLREHEDLVRSVVRGEREALQHQ